AYYVHPVNIQTACLIMEGAEFTENIINGVERPVKAAELFAFTLRVRAGNTDVLTDAEENVRQKLRAEGVRSEERFSWNAETEIVCRLLLEKKNGAGASELWLQTLLSRLQAVLLDDTISDCCL